jgi:ABC-type polysaccharide/polyol phosphate transport system ATPase subunit
MSSGTAIRAEGLGKKYLIGHAAERERYTALRDVLSRNVQNVWRRTLDMAKGRPVVAGDTVEEFWALKDLNFEIAQGDVVGIVGSNGAGKTTLLKILSRITEPTEGKVTIKGRVASLLEVGTGFHPELTGRENIYLNGAILGMSRSEIKQKFDEIVAFADSERFLDTPVKRYSSGMYVRLAFAVAAHLETDVLIVDEVLAVGDLAFQRKCLAKMGDISNSGRTVLFVSHSIGTIMSICQTGLLLKDGALIRAGKVAEVVKSYYDLGVGAPASLDRTLFQGPLSGIVFERIELNGRPLAHRNALSPNVSIALRITGRCMRAVPKFRFVMGLSCNGSRILTVHDGPETLECGDFEFFVEVPARLLRPNDYFIGLGGRRVDGGEWIWCPELAVVTVVEDWSERFDRDNEGVIDPSTIVTFNRTMGESIVRMEMASEATTEPR